MRALPRDRRVLQRGLLLRATHHLGAGEYLEATTMKTTSMSPTTTSCRGRTRYQIRLMNDSSCHGPSQQSLTTHLSVSFTASGWPRHRGFQQCLRWLEEVAPPLRLSERTRVHHHYTRLLDCLSAQPLRLPMALPRAWLYRPRQHRLRTHLE